MPLMHNIALQYTQKLHKNKSCLLFPLQTT